MQVFTDKGRLLNLVFSGKKGGEAKIYQVKEDPDHLAKIWHKNTPKQVSKINKLVGLHPVNESSWPIEKLFNDRAATHVVGFRMRKLLGEPWLRFNNASSRRDLPSEYQQKMDAQWAINISLALIKRVQEIHQAGPFVIGDINDGNFLVSQTGEVAIIDIDSMQINEELCIVARPEFVAPELQSCDFKSTKRTVEHDYFSLSVMLYQFWFNGVHPYCGGGEPFQVNERIAQNKCSCLGHAEPPSFAPRFKKLPVEIQKLFQDSFSSKSRPTPEAWIEKIKLNSSELRVFLSYSLFRPKAKPNTVSSVKNQYSNSNQGRQTSQAKATKAPTSSNHSSKGMQKNSNAIGRLFKKSLAASVCVFMLYGLKTELLPNTDLKNVFESVLLEKKGKAEFIKAMPTRKNDKNPASNIAGNSFNHLSTKNIQEKDSGTTGSIRLKEVMH